MHLTSYRMQAGTNDDDIKPTVVLQGYCNGDFTYVEAHRLILECFRRKKFKSIKDAHEYMLKWSYELAFAGDLQKLMDDNPCMMMMDTKYKN